MMTDTPIYMTPACAAQMRAELKELLYVKRPDTVRRVADAAAEGEVGDRLARRDPTGHRFADDGVDRPAEGCECRDRDQQRVAAARALVSRPDIIFADEPSGNLDSKSAAELLDFMQRAVREFGQTIVMVTHDPVAASYADRIVFLEDGRTAGEMHDPTTEMVIDRMKQFGG